MLIMPEVDIFSGEFTGLPLCGMLMPGTELLFQIGGMHAAIKEFGTKTDRVIGPNKAQLVCIWASWSDLLFFMDWTC